MISIIIVGYNSREYLKDCLTSIYKSTYKKFRVIFVDNNSSDESVAYIENSFPKTIIIKSRQNLGFAGGNNLGIKKAIKDKDEFIFLLNPDTVLDRNCIKVLVEQSDVYTILQPLILMHNNKKTNLINTTGIYLNFLGISYCDNYKKKGILFSNKLKIPAASGAGMFLPTTIFKEIGFFDENFFMYYEDLDFCWTARKSNYEIYMIPSAKLWHKYSFNKNKNKFFYSERNRLLFLYKHFSLKYYILISIPFFINELIILFYSLFSGLFIAKINSYTSFVNNYKKYKNKKNLKIEKRLLSLINAPISFSEFSNPLFPLYNLFLKFAWSVIRNLY